MKLLKKPYLAQAPAWPAHGRHIMAQFDDESLVVYQAYRPAIGNFAAQHGYFGGEFSPGRMSWIKPNFLWMMFRSGWGSKEGQEVVLAVWLKRAAFDSILSDAVESSFHEGAYPDHASWKDAVAASDVRLQWDPDHDPTGASLSRRAIQLGLRGAVLPRYSKEWILDLQDISPFVAEQRENSACGSWHKLITPSEKPYPVNDPAVAARLGPDTIDP